ncbi:unnamed protein product [Dovyalis caffra]|uniref:Uncharacterized protein n=1 Tax=Dovyalis caffra TaxID=77055 RepID=A0AAV1RJ05_9ROSI|nr:unnamed protein product [Dovyalis caffra]
MMLRTKPGLAMDKVTLPPLQFVSRPITKLHLDMPLKCFRGDLALKHLALTSSKQALLVEMASQLVAGVHSVGLESPKVR